MHPDSLSSTYRICLLTPDQRQSLISFLGSESEPESCPLPIELDEKNTVRVDPEEDIVDTGTYRDIWERAPRGLEKSDDRLRDTYTGVDYLSIKDRTEATKRALAKRERLLREKAVREGLDEEHYMSQLRRR